MDTAQKVSEMGALLDYPIACIGVPKTVDNDLPITDCCPGFGSAAKYIAISTREAALDVLSMARTSTKVFVLEVMGRHAGWMAAAAGLGGTKSGDAPHIILFPEITFDRERFLAKVVWTFWIGRSSNLLELYWQLGQFSRYPGDIYPWLLRRALMTVIPMLIVSNFPAGVLINKLEGGWILYGFALGAFFFAFTVWIWQSGLKKYRSASS